MDIEIYTQVLDDEYRLIGTTEEEVFFNKKEAIDFLEKTGDQLGGNIERRESKIKIESVDGLVFITEQFDAYVWVENNWTFYGKTRVSTWMQRKTNRWKLVQQHFSFPDAKADDGQTIGLEKITKENLELREAVKRRTFELELKNRELEIEAAVERVRARSLAMFQTNDLAKVNEELFAQLTKLRIEGFTGVAIYLVDEQEMVTVWDLSRPGSMGDVNSYAFKYDPKKYPTLGEFVPIWRSAKQEYFILDYPKEKLLKAADELEDVYYAMAENFRRAVNSGALQHQWNAAGRLSNGMLSLDLMMPPTEEAKSITLKMAAAFNLAYQRFHDLQMAEAQAKENQIQLALERVRAKTMAMYKSNDLANTSSILFQQIKELGFETWSCGFCIWKDDDIVESWMGADSGGLLPPLQIPYKEEHTHSGIFEAAQAGCTSYDRIWEGKELDAHYEFLATIPSVKEALDIMKTAGLSLPSRQCYYVGFFKKGYLLLITKEPNPQLKEISQRFAQAFDLTYTRFLDLQKAEAQTREAKMEASLERVRARAMAMHKSDELAEAAELLYQEFKKLHVAPFSCGYLINDEDAKHWNVWMTDANDASFKSFWTLPFDADRHLTGRYDSWKNKSDFHRTVLEGYENVEHHKIISRYAPWKEAAMGELPPKLVLSSAHFLFGHLLIVTDDVLSNEIEEALLRFAKVFEQSYVRFLDLQKAEAQIKESQIQLALERVRARAMAMQRSNELADASFVLDSQVRALGFQTWGCAFNIYGENESTEWFSSEMGTMPAYKTPRDNIFLRYYEAGKSGAQILIEEFEGDRCKTHYDYLCTVPVMGDALRKIIESGGSFPARQIDHVVYFKYGYLLFITLEPAPGAEEVFIRFAKVFEQTYTRFLDLQKAEAQTVRAEQDLAKIKDARKKAEDTLIGLQATQKQLIQSEKMASLGELTAGIAHEIQNPLNFVNNFSEVSKELLEEMKEALTRGSAPEAAAIANDIIQNLEKINHHGKRADSIVKGMLQHSQSSRATKESTDINKLADEYLRLCYHGLRAKDKSFNATIKTDFDAALPMANVIPQDIGRVILNVLANAFYAANERKKQLPNYESVVSVSTKRGTAAIQIEIADNGNGIPPNIIDKIFQPFFTTKPTGQGTGLGLSLSYDIITKGHGGELNVETKEGEGTTFIIQLNTL